MPGGCVRSAKFRRQCQQGLDHHADEKGAMHLGRSSASANMKDFSAPPYCMTIRAVGNCWHLADLCSWCRCSHERLSCHPLFNGNACSRGLEVLGAPLQPRP